MAKLEALLERRGVATPRELSEAIARCELHGGDLTTSLLQFVHADEAELSAVLSECHELAPAPVGLLPAPDDAASRSLPRDVAERYCCFPLEASPGRLVLAVASPFDAALKEELGLALGVTIEERVALEVRIRQALARFYGLPMSARNQRGIARLEGDLEAIGQETPLGSWSDTQLSTLPRPPSDQPSSLRETQRPPSGRPRSRGETPRLGAVTTPHVSVERPARRRGPLSLASAREELARAATRNEVLEIFFSFASQSFEYSALFAVHSSLAEGLDAWGNGADREALLGVGVPLDLPSSLSEAAETCKVRLTRLGKEGIDRTLMADLKRQHNNKALVLPVSLRSRCAVLLYADNGESDVVERDISDVVAIAPDVANALGRIILQRKKDAGRSRSVAPGESASPAPPRRSQPAHEPAAARSPSSPAAPEVRARERSAAGSSPRAAPAPSAPNDDGVSPLAAVAIGSHERPSGRVRGSAAPSGTSSARSATPLPASADDPVFLLARHARGSARVSAPSSPVPKPSVSITHPARLVASRPRLPSVIVDPESADPEASERATRAAAITRAPTQARSSSSPARRPAVPPPADAPRGPGRDDGARSVAAAATTIPAGRSRGLEEDLTVRQRTASIIGADAALAGPEHDDPIETSGNAWPPPIMDHSPPAPHQPLTALVPIIIADPPKGRRAHGAARSNAARGAMRSASSAATPTLPVPARGRRAEAPLPGKTRDVGMQVVGRAEPSPAPPAAQQSQVAASAPVAAGASLSDALVTATAAAAPAVLRVAAPVSASRGPDSDLADGANARPSASRAEAPTLPAPARSVSPTSAGLPAASVAASVAAASASAGVAAAVRAPSGTPGATPSASAAATAAPHPAEQMVATPPAAPRPSSAASVAPSSAPAASPGPRLAFAPPGSPSIPHAVGSLQAQRGPAAARPVAPAESSAERGSASAVTIPARASKGGNSIAPSVTITVAAAAARPGAMASAVVSKPASAASAAPSGPAPSGTITARPRAGEATEPSLGASANGRAPDSTAPSAAPESAARQPTAALALTAPSTKAGAQERHEGQREAGQRPGAERLAIFPPAPPDTEIEALVERACQGNLTAVHELARIGAHGLEQVMARFPGPVISERAGPSTRASECGPLLQALAAIGSPAMPSITQSSRDDDARVRRWATLLLGEMPGPEACRAVVQRLADDVPRVHQAALDAARLLLESPAADLFRATLFEVAEADDAALTLRLRTLEHVAKLKDSASVPRLIAFLGADLEPIVHKALWALTVVTRHDYGRDAGAWSEFWQKNKARHRIEWLIEALDEHDPRLRRAAADELREEAGDLYGYTEELPEAERHAAQAKLRQWWSLSGAARRVPASGSA